MPQDANSPLQLWGGPECTVNRIGDTFRDQTRLTGHHRRPGDLDQFADIGFKAIRYPALWERIAPHQPGVNAWRWTDERLPRLRALGLRPIVGLVHHGSGPRYTNLLDPSFAPGLAAHAGAVARRYPWIDAWTPVNEPLTTARFSALYGHWYPHLRDEAAFWLALLNQIDATRLAMAAIREVNPDAQLIQTEDLGRTYATPGLEAQADFDNDRRWMTFDLLAGRVTPDHRLWRRLADFGLAERLAAIARTPCPPDILGVNHYLTSDRFLDGRCHLYPEDRCEGNGRDRYADVEAIRALDPAPSSLENALRETWERYGAPIAVTEAHNGCTREEQLRWVLDAWDVAARLRSDGVDVRAVTAWALLGSYDWDSLLMRTAGRYEPGAFDVRGGAARPTATARLLTGLTAGTRPIAPTWRGEGWWRRDDRLRHAADVRPRIAAPARSHDAAPKILIAGGEGVLGQALAHACRRRGLEHAAVGRMALDLADVPAIDAYLEAHRPWAVLNAAGRSGIAWAQAHPAACFEANVTAAVALARACDQRGIAYVGFSSHQVFGEGHAEPCIESDRPDPLNVYGRSKAAADADILGRCGGALILRSAAFFSPMAGDDFARRAVRALRNALPFPASDNHVVTPTYVPDLADAALDLLIDGEVGLWHLSSGTAVSWREFGLLLAERFQLDGALLVEPARADAGLPRPGYSALGTRRGALLPSLDDALRRYAADITD